MKRARVPRCQHGNRPTKAAEGSGGLVATARGMRPALPDPCAECPLRRDSAPGYLGGYTPEMYLGILHGPASIACHKSPGFQERDIARQRHCTGVAAYRANVGHVCAVEHPALGLVPTAAHESTRRVGSDGEHYFATPEEFMAHHKPGQKG